MKEKNIPGCLYLLQQLAAFRRLTIEVLDNPRPELFYLLPCRASAKISPSFFGMGSLSNVTERAKL
jgi:hypothetical protein